MIKKGRLKWFRYVECEDDIDLVKHVRLKEDQSGQRGHLRTTCWDNVKNDMRSFGLPERIQKFGTDEEGKSSLQLANPGSPGKWSLNDVYVC